MVFTIFVTTGASISFTGAEALAAGTDAADFEVVRAVRRDPVLEPRTTLRAWAVVRCECCRRLASCLVTMAILLMV
jgi:hypothetical protein